MKACTLCGKCIKLCAYEARKIVDGKMVVDPSKCYGCAACQFVCPEQAITMVRRRS